MYYARKKTGYASEPQHAYPPAKDRIPELRGKSKSDAQFNYRQYTREGQYFDLNN
jgi:hypothetical protein